MPALVLDSLLVSVKLNSRNKKQTNSGMGTSNRNGSSHLSIPGNSGAQSARKQDQRGGHAVGKQHSSGGSKSALGVTITTPAGATTSRQNYYAGGASNHSGQNATSSSQQPNRTFWCGNDTCLVVQQVLPVFRRLCMRLYEGPAPAVQQQQSSSSYHSQSHQLPSLFSATVEDYVADLFPEYEKKHLPRIVQPLELLERAAALLLFRQRELVFCEKVFYLFGVRKEQARTSFSSSALSPLTAAVNSEMKTTEVVVGDFRTGGDVENKFGAKNGHDLTPASPVGGAAAACLSVDEDDFLEDETDQDLSKKTIRTAQVRSALLLLLRELLGTLQDVHVRERGFLERVFDLWQVIILEEEKEKAERSCTSGPRHNMNHRNKKQQFNFNNNNGEIVVNKDSALTSPTSPKSVDSSGPGTRPRDSQEDDSEPGSENEDGTNLKKAVGSFAENKKIFESKGGDEQVADEVDVDMIDTKAAAADSVVLGGTTNDAGGDIRTAGNNGRVDEDDKNLHPADQLPTLLSTAAHDVATAAKVVGIFQKNEEEWKDRRRQSVEEQKSRLIALATPRTLKVVEEWTFEGCVKLVRVLIQAVVWYQTVASTTQQPGANFSNVGTGSATNGPAVEQDTTSIKRSIYRSFAEAVLKDAAQFLGRWKKLHAASNSGGGGAGTNL
ncbi:unnamed protein product [Amoebophrya sp. A120]|nr:unnamed protein product [Amoebophrya sp. A120]|eukprot:GSA120T00020118001.1